MKTVLIVTLALATVASVQAERRTFYIGRDVHETMGYYHHANNTYVGLANPNYNRITFLYAHWIESPIPIQANHYHGLSNYFYTGATDNPTVVNSIAPSNVIPEYYTGLPGLKLAEATSGPYAGKLTSYIYADTSEDTGEEGHYSDLRTASVHELDGFTPADAEYWLRTGNRGTIGGPDGEANPIGRYSGDIIGADLVLELVDISAGLHVGVGSDIDIFDSGNTYALGDGETFLFDPTFWVDAGAAPGDYSASFILSDLNSATTGLLDSGVFQINFQVVPEPAALSLLLLGGLVMLRRRSCG